MSVLYQRLCRAYESARQQKKSKNEVVRYELNADTRLYELYHQILHRTYIPNPARAFVVRRPVDREIFAPSFQDRIVHHLIYHYLYERLDRQFIYDSYSCRVGRGTLFGVNRARRFLRQVSHSYTRDAYVLKLDVSGYFMNIHRASLLQRVLAMAGIDTLDITKTEKECLRYLIEVVVLNNVAENAERRSSARLWDTIPASKSLFRTRKDCGLPIGALTSQLFSNVYLNELDHKIKQRCRYYGRYVDDFLLMDTSKQRLNELTHYIGEELEAIGLKLHPNKVRLNHYRYGFYFLGQYIKPYRTYISRRTKKHIHQFLATFRQDWEASNPDSPSFLLKLANWENRFNSYFGILSQVNAHRYTQKIIQELPKEFLFFVLFQEDKERNIYQMRIKEEYRLKNNYRLCV